MLSEPVASKKKLGEPPQVVRLSLNRLVRPGLAVDFHVHLEPGQQAVPPAGRHEVSHRDQVAATLLRPPAAPDFPRFFDHPDAPKILVQANFRLFTPENHPIPAPN